VAKKSTTPPPPRRVQAPKQRTTPRAPGGRSPWLLPGVGAALGLMALAAVLGFVLLRDGGASAALTEAGCTVTRHASQGRDHVEELEEGFEYNSMPPTTGPHHGQPLAWDVYDEPLEQMRVVHNLEHGGLVIQYGEGVAPAEVDAIVEWYREDPNGIIVAPLAELGDEIALAAWIAPENAGPETEGEGVLAKCTRFDQEAFDEFKDTYGFRGPERFPREEMTPGGF
jgi:hypothetical protein